MATTIIEIIITVILIFTNYQLYKLEKFLRSSANEKDKKNEIENNFTKTVLFPVYTKYQIEYYQREAEKQNDKNKHYRILVENQEKLEILKHHKNGGNAKDFHPSSELISIIEKLSDTITVEKIATSNWKRAIEANISVLNGMSIDEAQKQYKIIEHTHGFIEETKIRKEVLENHRRYWLENWNKII